MDAIKEHKSQWEKTKEQAEKVKQAIDQVDQIITRTLGGRPMVREGSGQGV